MSWDVNLLDRVFLRKKLDVLKFKLFNFLIFVKLDFIYGLFDDVINYVV